MTVIEMQYCRENSVKLKDCTQRLANLTRCLNSFFTTVNVNTTCKYPIPPKAPKTYLTTLPKSLPKQRRVYPSQKVLFHPSIIVKYNIGKIVFFLVCYWSQVVQNWHLGIKICRSYGVTSAWSQWSQKILSWISKNLWNIFRRVWRSSSDISQLEMCFRSILNAMHIGSWWYKIFLFTW